VWYKYEHQVDRDLLSLTYVSSIHPQSTYSDCTSSTLDEMPDEIHRLPDDDTSDQDAGSSDEAGSDDGLIFNPSGLSDEQLDFLSNNMTEGERRDCGQKALDACSFFQLGLVPGLMATLESESFFKNMLSQVSARVSNAGTAVPPTVQPTEQQDRGEEQEEEEEDEGDAPATERSMSEAGTVPPQSETPTQP